MKLELGLSKNQNSLYLIAGVIQTVESLCITFDNRIAKEKLYLRDNKLAITERLPWIKLFPLITQKILQTNYYNAKIYFEKEGFIETKLDERNKYDYKEFRQ